MTNPTHILVVGAGAVGAFYGARMHSPERGVFVSAVARSNRAAVAANGFRIESKFYGDSIWHPHRLFSSCKEAASSGLPFAYIVVATKSLPNIRDDSVDLVPLIPKESKDTPAIVLIQNGFGIEWPYRSRFPQTPILSSVTIVSSQQPSPGVIQHNRWSRITIGPFFSKNYSDSFSITADPVVQKSIDTLVSLLRAGGVADAESVSAKDIQLVRWHKLAINAAFSPTAILSGGLGNWQIAADPDLCVHARGCMNEIFDAAPHVFGERLPTHLATPDDLIKSTIRNVGAKPSMLLDWESNRPIEIEVILGNPIRVALQHGACMPRLQTMYALLNSTIKQKKAASSNQSKL